MALIHCSFFSRTLMENTDLNIIIPTFDSADLFNPKDHHPEHGFKTLYLLHGMYGNYADWERYTGIEAYAQAKNLAVIMPSAANSFYTDMAHGNKYYTYITEELPVFAKSLFPISDTREDTFIAGLSMGGYGAWKIALNHPERFSYAASLSGAVDINTVYKMACAPGFSIDARNI